MSNKPIKQKREKRSPEMRNITKNIKENCVMARIMRANIKHQKNFSVKKHGGWDNAVAAARVWLDELKKSIPEQPKTTFGKMSTRNSSGVVGVSLNKSTVKRPSGVVYEYWKWIAKWPGVKPKSGLQWTIAQEYSDDMAFVLAVLSRQLLSSDRDLVLAEYERIKGTEKEQEILSRKLLYFE